MELICPSCTRKLSIADQYAGQVVRCPLCAGMFQAPALSGTAAPPAAPPAPPPPAPASPPVPMTIPIPGPVSSLTATPPTPGPGPDLPRQEIFSFADGHGHVAPSPPPVLNVPIPDDAPLRPLDAAPAKAPPVAPPEPVPPGDFTKSIILRLRPDILGWVAPVSVASVFFLSFFPWIHLQVVLNLAEGIGSFNLWGLGFGAGSPVYMTYAILTIFLGLPLAWVVFAFDKGWLPKVPALAPVWPYRHLIVGGVLLLALVLTAPGYLTALFVGTPLGLGLKLALRLQLAAIVALVLQHWLERRLPLNLPLPRLSIRW